MTKVSIRELNQRTSEIIRKVRENYEVVEETYRGKIARITPAHAPESDMSFDEWWKERMKLADELGKLWPEGLTAAQAIAEDRE